jgi:predicted transcriptional regulator of viral defense system
VGRGVYRVSHYPRSREDATVEALAALGDEAVLSHESALALYDVSDVAPARLHVTIPRARRYRTPPVTDLVLHTISRPLETWEVDQHHGFRSTSLPRSIVDAARTGTAPEQIVAAVRNGLQRGVLTRDNLARAIARAPRRSKELVEQGITEAATAENSRS